jgi:hypothetical protein
LFYPSFVQNFFYPNHSNWGIDNVSTNIENIFIKKGILFAARVSVFFWGGILSAGAWSRMMEGCLLVDLLGKS